MASPASNFAQIEQEIEAVYRIYAALARDLDSEYGLGGKLVYAGELRHETCRLVRAANIAGAGSLCATADAAMQRLAIREGVIDFLVTSLDEALRILKNEIRKRSAVAVCIGAPPARILAEMVERGVLPDLLPPVAQEDEADFETFEAQGARRIEQPAPLPDRVLVVAPNPPADFEARALEQIGEEDHAVRRWLRLSPRYLGPEARRVRSAPSGVKGL